MAIYDEWKILILPLNVIKKKITSAFGFKGMISSGGPGNEGINLATWINERIDDGTIDVGIGITDGDKGDITVTSTGTIWTIDDNSVTNTKAADMLANSIKSRPFATVGDPFDITLGPNQTIGRGPTGDILALNLGTNLSISGSTINAAVIASGVPNTPAGTIAATNVQTAINELDTEKQVDILWQEETSPIGSAGTIHTVKFVGAGVLAESPLADGILTVNIPGGTAYTAGTGINISGGNVISNTAPDQTVVITGATGTYPNFTLPTNEVPLTFTSGLTRTVNTVTNDLITGKSGGQTIFGGTASGENLTLSSTTNATKGKIIFGSSSAYDGTNMRLGINSTTPTSRLDILTTGIAVAQDNSYGLTLINTTVAAAGVQQMSPPILWEGQGWKTTATAGSQIVRFIADILPVQGTTSPTGLWQLKSSIDGGAYTNRLTVGSDGSFFAGIAAGNSFTLNATVGVQMAGGSNGAFRIRTISGGYTTFFTVGQNYDWNSQPGTWVFKNENASFGNNSTTGTGGHVVMSETFKPASGTAVYSELTLNPIINQTGSATGATYGLRINPTLTSVLGVFTGLELNQNAHIAIYQSGSSSNNRFAGQTIIGAITAPTTSAALEVASTTGALLIPRMTTIQRDALIASDGMILYNITDSKFQGREAGAWVNLI